MALGLDFLHTELFGVPIRDKSRQFLVLPDRFGDPVIAHASDSHREGLTFGFG